VSHYGIFAPKLSASIMQNSTVGGNFQVAAIETQQYSMSFQNVIANNGIAGRPAWNIRPDLSDQSFSGATNFQFPSGDPNLTTYLPSLAVSSITGLDLSNGGMKRGRNVRGINYSVTAGASFLDVVFPTTYATPGPPALTPASGGKLPNGAYCYACSRVNQLGETSPGIEASVILSGTNNAVSVSTSAAAPSQSGWKYRVYRGRTSGVYDGYYEMPLNVSGAFTDNGAPFTGTTSGKFPGIGGAPSGAEPDSRYSVTVEPQWDAGSTWISNKATTGFRINFHTPPPASSALDWHLIR
jgi:hypothetical protein